MTETLPSDSADLIRAIVTTLDDFAEIDRVWPKGLVHTGGPHYRLRGMHSPISIGDDECQVFGRLIEAFRPVNAFIIGNAFGLSSVFIAKMMERCGGRSVITLDSKSEGNGERCFCIAAELSERLHTSLLTNKVGWSPKDIDNAVEDDSYDLIFIDGKHAHPQVTLDFEGCGSLIHDCTIVCWHDYWVSGIPQSVAVAEKNGFHCLKVNTSCEMVFGTLSQERFERLSHLFSNGEPPRRRFRVGAFLKVLYALIISLFNTYLLRRR